MRKNVFIQIANEIDLNSEEKGKLDMKNWEKNSLVYNKILVLYLLRKR